jgi:hypothetical protein
MEMFDGLDAGAHGANLFSTPATRQNPGENLLLAGPEMPDFIAAYRTVAGENFRILWPTDSTQVCARVSPATSQYRLCGSRM